MYYEKMREVSDRIYKIPVKEWPRIYNELRHRNWPEELGEEPIEHIKRDDWSETQIILSRIENRCGLKAIFRESKLKEGYTSQMFDDWWDSNFIAGKSAEYFKKETGDEVVKQPMWLSIIISIGALIISITALILS